MFICFICRKLEKLAQTVEETVEALEDKDQTLRLAAALGAALTEREEQLAAENADLAQRLCDQQAELVNLRAQLAPGTLEMRQMFQQEISSLKKKVVDSHVAAEEYRVAQTSAEANVAVLQKAAARWEREATTAQEGCQALQEQLARCQDQVNSFHVLEHIFACKCNFCFAFSGCPKERQSDFPCWLSHRQPWPHNE